MVSGEIRFVIVFCGKSGRRLKRNFNSEKSRACVSPRFLSFRIFERRMGLFDKLFTKPQPGEPVNLGRLGVDMHSHFIPGIDDGAKTTRDSLELLKGMEELGYRKVITTADVVSDFFRNTPDIIRS